jgi:predicted NAD/FAD-binding protein
VIGAAGTRDEPRRMSRPRRIAIVGAGVSGLTAVHLLHARHDVTLFEAAARPGGHACTLDVPVPEGGAVAVDVGFMVLNDRTYPQFHALLAELGIRTRVSDMSFSVSDGRDFEYGGRSLDALFANRRHLADRRFLRMVAEYARFNREARALLASDAQPSLRGWLQERGFSKYFVERLLVPQASAIWSADPGQMWTFPARFLLEFFANHGMLRVTGRPTWQTIVGGSRAYVDAICARLGDRAQMSSPVASVRRTGDGAVDVTVAGRAPMRFDDVVLACHADAALALLADPTPAETAVLGAIAYQPSELVLHSDDRLLPRRRAAHASWNAHLVEPTPAAPTLTYDLKRLQGLETALPVLATLNLRERIDPMKVHATFRFAHPVYTPDAVAAQRRHAEISGADRIHFAGAYWSSGFHEDGVASAHRVAAALDAAPRREPVAA